VKTIDDLEAVRHHLSQATVFCKDGETFGLVITGHEKVAAFGRSDVVALPLMSRPPILYSDRAVLGLFSWA
jgi:hypothetical protein